MKKRIFAILIGLSLNLSLQPISVKAADTESTLVSEFIVDEQNDVGKAEESKEENVTSSNANEFDTFDPANTTIDVANANTSPNTSGISKQENSNMMNYNSVSQEITHSFTTKSQIVCLEFYTTDGYLSGGNSITLDIGEAGYKISANMQQGEIIKGTNPNTLFMFAGTIPLTDYGLECNKIYATLPAGTTLWQMDMVYATSLRECFVVEAEVPSDWNTSTAITTNKPLNCLGIFINTDTSTISPDMLADITQKRLSLENGVVTEIFNNTAPKQKEQVDYISILLVFLAILLTIGVIVTAIIMNKQKNKMETQRRDKSISTQNNRLKKKKEKEADLLREMYGGDDMDYFGDDLDDDEPFEEPKPDPLPEMLNRHSTDEETLMNNGTNMMGNPNPFQQPKMRIPTQQMQEMQQSAYPLPMPEQMYYMPQYNTQPQQMTQNYTQQIPQQQMTQMPQAPAFASQMQTPIQNTVPIQKIPNFVKPQATENPEKRVPKFAQNTNS